MFKTLLALALTTSFAHASVIQVEAAAGTTNFLGSAEAYRTAVELALTGPSHQSAVVADYTSVSHQALFGGNGGYAWKSTINFGVATAANYSFQAGVDFGRGGAMFLDGVAVDFKGYDIYWGNNFNNPSQFLSTSALLAAGNHVLSFYGFEGCCDGAQRAQFSAAGSAYKVFGDNDGLSLIQAPVAPVSEPGSVALFAAGLGIAGLIGRRRNAALARSTAAAV